MALFTQCALTDTNGVDLNAHTTGGCSPHTAATWSRQGNVNTNAAIFAANRARPGTTNAQIRYQSSGAPADADYSVYCDLVVQSNSGRAGLLGRAASGSGDSAYFFRYNNTTTAWELFRLVTGTTALIGSATATLVVGATYAMELRMIGTTITGAVNGHTVVTVIDSNISAANAAGLFFFDASAPSDSTGYHIDNFRGDDTPGTDDPFRIWLPSLGPILAQ